MHELPPNPTVSVVICTYSPDMYEHFRETAESVLGQTYEEVELVVVVDGSDEVFEWAVSEFESREDVVLHANESNVGLLESRNTGVELATGDVVAFIDDDAVAHERWIEELASTYREQALLAVGGRMVPEWITGRPDFLPEEFYWLVGVTHKGFADGPGEIRNTFGSNISFRRDVFLELGGFDVNFGGRKGSKNLQGGETELAARLRDNYGRGVFYNPNAVVAHKIFEYRTRFRWLLNRAFWQGYSKRTMANRRPDSVTRENEYLVQLIFDFGPARLRELVAERSIVLLKQFAVLWLLIVVVGLGYIYGSLPRSNRGTANAQG